MEGFALRASYVPWKRKSYEATEKEYPRQTSLSPARGMGRPLTVQGRTIEIHSLQKPSVRASMTSIFDPGHFIRTSGKQM